MSEHSYERAKDDDPDRCQAVCGVGQCKLKATPGLKYCRLHGGFEKPEEKRKEGLRNYRLTKFNTRLAELGDAPEIKSLRDEIAILRILMEERLNQCNDTKDLIYQSGPISDLVMKIDKVVTSCHKLEQATGALLDKQTIVQFGIELINLIGEAITDEEILKALSDKIQDVVIRTIAVEDE